MSNNQIISPGVSVFNTPDLADGRLDFYLGGAYKWGFELVAEGRHLAGHQSRFTTGAYSRLELRDYLVINFQQQQQVK